MLTLSGLVQLMPAIAFTDEDAMNTAHHRRVSGASPADVFLHRPSGGAVASHLLLTCIDAPWWSDADRCMWAVRTLAQSEASALLVLPSKTRSPQADVDAYGLVASAARRLRLPLLVMQPGAHSEENLLETVTRVVAVETARAESRYLETLVDYLRPSGSLTAGDLTDLMEHTSRVVDGHAAVIAPDGSFTGQAQTLQHILRGKAATSVTRIREGRIGAASVDQAGYNVQLVGVGAALPRPVLAVARRNPFPLQTANLVNRTAAALAVHERLAGSESIARELRRIVPLARLAIFTQLMNGDVATSRKLAKSLLPDLLNASHFQVFVLECSVHQRATVLRACEEAVPRQVLMVESPMAETHVVLIAQAQPTQGNDSVRRRLEAITVNHSCYLGESRPVHLDRLRDGHQMATQALVVARRLPGRSAAYHGEHQLGHVLDEAAQSWARNALEPLGTLAVEERQELVMTMRQALRHGHSGAARQMRLNRKTVAVRCKRVETLLGLDLNNLQARAHLDLALQVTRFPAGEVSSPAAKLPDLLRTSAAREWASDLVAPLRRDSRPLLRTARAWIACNGRVETCAEHLGSHPNTVRNHLAACEELLGRRIVGSGGGANDLLLALEILAGVEDR